MPFAYLCPFCKQAVQIANRLPPGRAVKCPTCQKLYLAGAPGAVGTAPAAPAPAKPAVPAPAKPPAATAGMKSPPPAGTRAASTRMGRVLAWLRGSPGRIAGMELKQVVASGIFLFMLALIPLIFAWTEWRIGSTATTEPLAVELGQLEKGQVPDNNHLKIGSHVACYFATVFTYTSKDRRQPDLDTKVDYAFYPIISADHPYFHEVRRIQEKYRNVKTPPDEIDWPELSDFRVLVRTNRFKTVGDIPDDDTRTDPAVQGLVINRISTLDAEEQRLIKQDFPDIDFNKVLILSEGRRPSSGLFCLFLAILSVPFLLGFFGIVGIWIITRTGIGRRFLGVRTT
jgi:hypothetical protein